MNASTISRHLRSVGFQPMGSANRRTRQGLRVTDGYSGVRVCADLDSDREAADLAIAARQALIAAGYTLNLESDNPAAFHVTGRN
jgi:hypothetical protein